MANEEMLEAGYHDELKRRIGASAARRVQEVLLDSGVVLDEVDDVDLGVLQTWSVIVRALILDARIEQPYKVGAHYSFVGKAEDIPFLRQAHDRIKKAVGRKLQAENIAEIKEAVEETVEDPAVKKQLTDQISEIAKRQEDLAKKFEAGEEDYGVQKRKLEIRKATWEYRKTLLQREPAAVLIGGLLLLIITVTLLVAMFLHTTVPEIVSSAFLLILGFFFGQTAGGKRDDN